jgi:hypothetical protein
LAPAAAALLVACGGSTQEAQQSVALDPAACNGAWAFEVVNNSNSDAVVYWAPSVLQTREWVGEVRAKDNRIWFKRSPVEEVPEVWVEHEGAEVGWRNTAALRAHRIQIAVACDPRAQQGG